MSRFPANSYPCLIGIFCDVCGETDERDYLVHEDWTQQQRFAAARKHLNANGWRCDVAGDFCPEHAKERPDLLAALHESIKGRRPAGAVPADTEED